MGDTTDNLQSHPTSSKLDKLYENIINNIRQKYGHLTENEIHEGARNLISLCKVLLAIDERLNQNQIEVTNDD